MYNIHIIYMCVLLCIYIYRYYIMIYIYIIHNILNIYIYIMYMTYIHSYKNTWMDHQTETPIFSYFFRS